MPSGIFKNPEERSKKISEALKGRKCSKQELKRLKRIGFQKGHKKSLKKGDKRGNYYFSKVKVFNTGRTRFKKGHIPANKGIKKPIRNCPKCGKELKRYGNSKVCKKCRDFTWGDKISKSLKGKPNFKVRGKNHGLWKNGITPINNKIRGSLEYKLWQDSIFSRDRYTCQKTNIKGGILSVHHIKNFAQYPELRFAINNGITFSKKMHEKFHMIYGKKNNTKEQVEEFIGHKL